MVMNAMSTFQSLTVHCARCHDHKFDPITQRDYYGLQAVFAGVDRADRSFDTNALAGRQRRELASQLKALMSERVKMDAEVAQLGGDEMRRIDAKIAEAKKASRPNTVAFGYHSAISPIQSAEKWVQVDLGKPQALHG